MIEYNVPSCGLSRSLSTMNLYQHLLVAIDDSDMSERVLEHAFKFASIHAARLSLMSVVALDPMLHADFYAITPAIQAYFEAAQQRAQARLAHLQTRAEALGLHAETFIMTDHLPGDGILQLAASLQPDCIVMGSQGRHGIEKWLLGSVAQHVLTRTKIPVLIIK